MIYIRMTQARYEVPIDDVRRDLQAFMVWAGYGDADMGVWLTTNPTIRRYNERYRGKARPTDILSFRAHPYDAPGFRCDDLEDAYLGDCIISVERAARDAREADVALYARLQRLFVHGIAHLCGYDHDTDERYERMRTYEMRMMQHRAVTRVPPDTSI